jgi:hypothetical protein
MKSLTINFYLLSTITILLVLSIFTKNYLKLEFFTDSHSPREAIQYLKNVEAYKITKPNDDSYYGLNKEDTQRLDIKENNFSDITPITWTALDYIYKKVLDNNEHIKNLQSEIFSSTRRTLELMGKLDITEITNKL